MKKISLLLLVFLLAACPAFAETVYPLEGDNQLSFHIVGGIHYHSDYTSEDESPYHNYIEEATGVDIKWSRAPAGADENMTYNMMIANGEYPDMVYKWELPAYAEAAIAEGIVLPIEDYMEEYAPALNAYLNEHPEVRKAITTDSGHMYVFPFLYEDPSYLGTTQGASINVDLLEKTGLDMPVTIADWDEVLYAMRDLEECDYPLAYYFAAGPRQWFGNAFGFNGYDRYYVDVNGKVATWANAEGYRDFLATMSRWYADGIIDKDFATTDITGLVNKIMTSGIGSPLYGVNTPARFYDQMVKRDGHFPFVPATQPVANEGDTVYYAMGANEWLGVGAFITTACKDVPTAMRFLDYAFTEKGVITWNFGKEGDSFYYDEAGTPHINQDILESPEGSTAALGRYTSMTGVGLGLQDIGWFNDKALPFVPDMISAWSMNSEAGKHHWPCVSSTVEESEELSSLENAINTYADEMYINFIIGAESLDKYDEYLKNLEEMGLDRVLEIKTEQLDRYNSR